MRSRRLLFGILLLLMGLSVSYKNSAGKNNPCPYPDDPSMVQHPNINIEGKDGDTVILPCSTKDQKDISYDRVEWFKGPTMENNKPIHKYVWRSDPPQSTRPDFEGRTSLSVEQLYSGNCSLSLLVNTSHSGTYYCCVPRRLCCTVTLKVHPKGEATSQEQDNQKSVSGGQTQKVVHGDGIVSLLLIGIITLVVYCC